MNMHAITVKQPWASAIARFGKSVENRPRRPPAHLIGQRIAIHVSQARDVWDQEFAGSLLRSAPLHLRPLHAWIGEIGMPIDARSSPPNAGRIIATALLAGWCLADLPDGINEDDGWLKANGVDGPEFYAATGSDWFTGPVGWVLADVRALTVPVGQGKCGDCRGDGWHFTGEGSFPETCRRCAGDGNGRVSGKVYPFALAPEVTAAVLAAEVSNG